MNEQNVFALSTVKHLRNELLQCKKERNEFKSMLSSCEKENKQLKKLVRQGEKKCEIYREHVEDLQRQITPKKANFSIKRKRKSTVDTHPVKRLRLHECKNNFEKCIQGLHGCSRCSISMEYLGKNVRFEINNARPSNTEQNHDSKHSTSADHTYCTSPAENTTSVAAQSSEADHTYSTARPKGTVPVAAQTSAADDTYSTARPKGAVSVAAQSSAPDHTYSTSPGKAISVAAQNSEPDNTYSTARPKSTVSVAAQSSGPDHTYSTSTGKATASVAAEDSVAGHGYFSDGTIPHANNCDSTLSDYHDIYNSEGNFTSKHIRKAVMVTDNFRISNEAYHEIRLELSGHMPPIGKVKSEKAIMSEEIPYKKHPTVSLFSPSLYF